MIRTRAPNDRARATAHALARLGTPLLALLPLFAGCASAARRPALTDASYPGELRAPRALARDVLWRQRVTAWWGKGAGEGAGERRGFDAVVQKKDDALTVMGLSPLGAMGFAVVLRNGALEVIDHLPEPMPFPPRFLVLDVQRALYPWLPGAEPRPDGELRAEVDGEAVSEIWRAGRLFERRFTRLDGAPPGTIVVRYEGGRAPNEMPPRLTLDNGWFGYRLEVETLAEQSLDGLGGTR